MHRIFQGLVLCSFVSVGVTIVLCGSAVALESGILKGRVVDVEDNPVAGAVISIYDSTNSRRRPDFVSSGTDKNGRFNVALPPGRYWAVARLKRTEGFGPLMPGDRHSGEPTEFELASGGEVVVSFVVADLKEALRAKTRGREGAVSISGRILDERGAPVSGSYAIANRNEVVSGIPDYISAWVDAEGRYTLYVPRGRYYIGGAVTFPPGQHYSINGQVTVDNDTADVVIVMKSNDAK